MIFLNKRRKFFSKDNYKDINIDEIEGASTTLKGYRFVTRQEFTSRKKTNLLIWIIEHIFEVKVLILQIGLINTLRFLIYASSPKVIYVDAIELQNNISNNRNIYVSKSGIPLLSKYSNLFIQNNLKKIENLDNEKISATYEIENLKKKSKILKNIEPKKLKTFKTDSKINWLVAGSGNFAASILVPSINNAGGKVIACCSNAGLSSYFLSRSYNINNTFLNIDKMLDSNLSADNILIATPPLLHPAHIKKAIKNNLKIYCEKPVAINYQGLEELEQFAQYPQIMIGFNRRFAPAIDKLINSYEFKSSNEIKMLTYVVNLGEFSVAMASKEIGGGTTVGSCCHYLDLIEYLLSSKVSKFKVISKPDRNDGVVYGFSFSCILTMENGSLGTLVFERSKKPAKGVKELISIFGTNFTSTIKDFEKIEINKKTTTYSYYSKGWKNAMKHFLSTKTLSESSKTPTLKDGIRICKLAMDIDSEILKENKI